MKHLEFLIEDASGKAFLEVVVPKIVGDKASFRIISYRGIGRLPSNLRPGSDARKRILLDQLPRIIAGYGRAFENDPPDYKRGVVIICDLDDRDKSSFISEIRSVVNRCEKKPTTIVALAIEEGEAWLLGDQTAVASAYPRVNKAELAKYVPDSICGTWETLADLVERGGSKELKKDGYQFIGRAKIRWAELIGSHVEPNRNQSPSFNHLHRKLNEFLI